MKTCRFLFVFRIIECAEQGSLHFVVVLGSLFGSQLVLFDGFKKKGQNGSFD